MSKYDMEDKIVLEISHMDQDNDYRFRGIGGWLSGVDVDNDNYAEPLTDYTEKAYEEGAEKAWELAQQIMSGEVPGHYTTAELYEMFGTYSQHEVLKKHTYAEAAAKVEAWRKKNEIHVGDVVIYKDISRQVRGVVTKVTESCIGGITSEGSIFNWFKVKCTKTDRHIDIESVMAQIKG